jgi:hypothetical protein
MDKVAVAQGRLAALNAPPPLPRPGGKPPIPPGPIRTPPPPKPLYAPPPQPLNGKPAKPAPAPAQPKPGKAKNGQPIEVAKPDAEELAARRAAEHERKEKRRQKEEQLFKTMIELRQQLFLLFPTVFSTDPAPLAVGIREEIIEATAWEKAEVNGTLAHWTSDPIYLRAVLTKPHRLHLDGSIDRPITDADRANATKKMKLHLKRIGVFHAPAPAA